MSRDIKQFKMNNGEEIVCEVLEWPEEDMGDIIVRRAFELKTIISPDHSFYMFKPWLAMQEGIDKFISVNPLHIIAEAIPASRVKDQWQDVVNASEGDEELTSAEVDKLTKKLKDLYDNMSEEDKNKVVPVFKPKETMH